MIFLDKLVMYYILQYHILRSDDRELVNRANGQQTGIDTAGEPNETTCQQSEHKGVTGNAGTPSP